MVDKSARAPGSGTEQSFEALRSAFTRVSPGFTGFGDKDSPHYLEERLYKDELIEVYRRNLVPKLTNYGGGLEAARALLQAVRIVLTERLPSAGAPQNLLNWRYFDFLTRLDDAAAVRFADALAELLRGEGYSAERLERFNSVAWPIWREQGSTGPAITRSFPTLLLMLHDPGVDLYIRTSDFEAVYDLLYGRDLFDGDVLDARQYADALAMAADTREKLVSWGWTPRDMVDVQSFIYAAAIGLREGPAGDPQGAFDALLGEIADEGLVFSQETVANYLLALQSKRFVILTGISGTGKTRLAMAVAKHYQPKVFVEEVTDLPDGAHELVVRPYMLRHRRIVLPVALVADLRLEMTVGAASGQVAMQYPGGEQLVSVWRDLTRGAVTLYPSGRFGEWFLSEFAEGDRFALKAMDWEAPPENAPMQLLVPQTRAVEAPFQNRQVVAVRPDWTDNRGLLGYFNPITERYMATPFLEILLRARVEELRAVIERREARPFFVVLDEMNLARVEHYFSDFLSCMESEEPLHLHDSDAVASGEAGDQSAVPCTIDVPKNLYFTGTVNVDETTHMFSPKVLDRAFTIELNDVDLRSLGLPSLRAVAAGEDVLSLRQLPHALEQLPRARAEDWREFNGLLQGRLAATLMELHELLEAYNRHFGYRVALEIARYVCLARRQAGGEPEILWAALDLALLQKALPKLSGTQQELQDVLSDLERFAEDRGPARRRVRDAGERHPEGSEPVSGPGAALEAESPAGESDDRGRRGARLPRMAEKIQRMRQRLERQGFASFIE